MSIVEYKYYYYCCDEIDDIGYGCTYRCIQTLLSAIKYYKDPLQEIPTFMQIINFFGKDINNYNKKSDLWLEPHDVYTFLKSVYGLDGIELLYLPTGRSIENILKTPIQVYTQTQNQIYKQLELEIFKNKIENNFIKNKIPIIIDNGIYTYIVSDCKYNCNNILEVTIIDPHRSQTHSQVYTRICDEMFANSLWMVYMLK
jgi:hypothetical protein